MTTPPWWVRPNPEDVKPAAPAFDRCPRCSHGWHGLACTVTAGLGATCGCETAWEAS